MDKLKIASLSPQPLVLILAVAVLIGVPLRTFQISNCIDPETGFWLVQGFTVPLLYALCILIVIIALGISFFSGIMPAPEFSEKRSIPMGVISILFTLTFLMDAISQMGTYIAIFGNYVAEQYPSFFTYMVSTGSLALTLQSIFGLLAAFYFALVAFSHFLGNASYAKTGFLAITPVLWGIFRMIYYFANPISYKNVSQLLLEMGTLTFIMIFFLSFARIASKVNEESSMWILWFSGTAGAFFGYVSTFAPLALMITGKGNHIPNEYPIQYTDLVFALFATATLLSNLPRTIKANTENTDSSASVAAASVNTPIATTADAAAIANSAD